MNNLDSELSTNKTSFTVLICIANINFNSSVNVFPINWKVNLLDN